MNDDEPEREFEEDQLQRIEDLKDQAEMFNMDVDWESLALIPKKVVKKKYEFADQDNWAGSPEQAHA